MSHRIKIIPKSSWRLMHIIGINNVGQVSGRELAKDFWNIREAFAKLQRTNRAPSSEESLEFFNQLLNSEAVKESRS